MNWPMLIAFAAGLALGILGVNWDLHRWARWNAPQLRARIEFMIEDERDKLLERTFKKSRKRRA